MRLIRKSSKAKRIDAMEPGTVFIATSNGGTLSMILEPGKQIYSLCSNPVLNLDEFAVWSYTPDEEGIPVDAELTIYDE